MAIRSAIIWITSILTVVFSGLFFYFSRIECLHPHCVELYAKDSITKLYSLYLIFLVVIAVLSILVAHLPYKIRYFLEKDVCVPSCRNPLIQFFWFEGSILECLAMIGVLALMTVNFILYWNMMLAVSDPPLEVEDYWAAGLMGTGHMGDILLGLILIPLGRHSFLPALLKIHIDAALRFHKRCGILLCLVTAAHGGVIWTKITTLRNPPSYIYWTFNIGVEGQKWIFYISKAGFMTTFGFIAGAAILILWIFTFPRIRRRFYHIFYGVHIIFGPIMIMTACLHTSSIWYYSMPGAFLLLTDWIIRLYHYTIGVKSLVTREACGYIRIDILDRMKLDVGGFVMIKIKELGYQIGHPYTVASDPNANSLVLLVKPSLSPTEWTHQLATLVPFGCSPKEITVRIDGPFGGLKFSITHMNVVASFVGGVGVAGALAIASHVLNYSTGPRLVFIFWAARELTAGNLSVLQELRSRRDPRLRIHLYGRAATFLFNHCSDNQEARLNVEVGINLSDEFYNQSLAYNIESEGIGGSLERMIPEVLLRQEVLPAMRQSERIGIYTCGPKALMDSVQKACEEVPKTVKIYLHRESFEW